MSILDRSWWEQPYVDLWTVPHVLFGAGMAAFGIMFGVDPFLTGAAAVVLAVAWEIFEHAFGISKVEKRSNIFGDVVAAALGYVSGYGLFTLLHGSVAFSIALGTMAFVLVMMNLLGAYAYQRYRRQKRAPEES